MSSSALPASSGRRLLVLCLVLFGAIVLLVGQLMHAGERALRLPLYDFVAFWSANQLNAAGVDPFDPNLLRPIQERADPGLQDVLVMWSAPWTLAVTRPFSLLEPIWARLAWVLCMLAVLLAGVDVAWRHLGGPASHRWVAWLMAFSFLPTYMVLAVGQLGPLFLVGFVGFLVCLRKEKPGLAGAFLVLAALKPQLSYLFWVALAVWAVHGRQFRLVAGGLIGVSALMIWPLAENPQLLNQYVHALTHRNQVHGHTSPLLASALRLWIAPDVYLLQFAPMLAGFAWLGWYGWRHRHNWNWDERLPALLFASLLTAPYGAWPFDLVVLLPALLMVCIRLTDASRARQTAFLWGYLVINALALMILLMEVAYFWFVWMAPALLLLTHLGRQEVGVHSIPVDGAN